MQAGGRAPGGIRTDGTRSRSVGDPELRLGLCPGAKHDVSCASFPTTGNGCKDVYSGGLLGEVPAAGAIPDFRTRE